MLNTYVGIKYMATLAQRPGEKLNYTVVRMLYYKWIGIILFEARHTHTVNHKIQLILE